MPLSETERKAAARERYLANREKILAKAKQRYAEMREQLLAYQAAYNKEKRTLQDAHFLALQREKRAKWRDKDREHCRRLDRLHHARMMQNNPERVRETNKAASRRYYDKIKHDLRRQSEKNARKELRKAIGAPPPPELLAAEVERRMLLRAIREQSA